MSDIQIFSNPDFGEIRTIIIDGDPWFCGKDIAGSLGYTNEKNAVKRHCDEGEVSKQTLGVQTGIKRDGSPAIMNTDLLFVNESGLYSLIFGSKLESAKKFKKWVTSEVLPEIRKTGTYGVPQLPTDPMKLLELHYQAIKQVDNKVNTLEQKFDKFEKSLPLLPNEADEVSNAVKKRVVEILGGKESAAYKNRSICQKVFMDAYRELKRNFNVARYKDIKREQKAQAIEIVSRYNPPLFLNEQIEQENAQITMDTVA